MSIKLIDFKDIQDSIIEELKIQSSDTVSIQRIKRSINEVYINEVVPHARWKWLENHTKVRFNAAYSSGTAEVTPSSATVTLDPAPSSSLGSFANQYFSVAGHTEVYIVKAHTAGSATLTLTSEFLGVFNETASFKVWSDKVALPTDCRETVTVWHNMYSRPMDAMGWQKFRELTINNPKLEGYPRVYYTGDFVGDLDATRYRELRVHPAIHNVPVTVSIDYVRDVVELTDDGDEPVIPMEDRIVLKYGALAWAWRALMRNPEEANTNYQLFKQKLERMAGKIEDSHDKPQLTVDSLYMKRRRAPKYKIGTQVFENGSGGSSNSASSQFLLNPVIQGARITADVTVDSGVTVDGVDISVLAQDFADHLTDAIDAHDASSISNIPSGNLAATDVQSALNELQTELDGKASSSEITDHINDATDAHDASAISFSPVGSIVATDAQAAIAEVATDAASALSSHESDTTSIHGIADTADLLTTTNTKVVTNKDIDGGTASNTSRITLPKASKATLDALTRKEATVVYASDTDKLYYDDGSVLKLVGSGSGGAVNFISDGDAEGANIWTAYALTEAVTFTDAGDLVNLTAHGLSNGQTVSFSVITTTTGISVNTLYYVVGSTTNTFQVASTSGGSALALTTNGSGTLVRSRPVTGTGGSPSVTATISATTPLAGTNSFLLTKGASNLMAQGISTTFSVDLAYRAKVCQIEFDYIVGSGTFVAGSSSADSDIIAYIYDVTNSTLIEPSSIKLLSNSTTLGDKFVANFQTSATGASYRLILHCATPSTSAYTLKLDSVRVGPCDYVYGTPITDWATYTPSNTQGLGTIASANLKWRRVGDTMQIQGGFTTGTVTASTAQLGLPSGATIGGTSSTRAYAGETIRNGGSRVTNFAIQGVTYLTFGGGASSHGDLPGNSAFGSTEVLYITAFDIPISGWSSSVQVSDGYDARKVNLKLSTNAGSIGTSATTWTTVTFSTPEFDDVAGWNGTDTYTFRTQGDYEIGLASGQLTGAANYYRIGYRVNSGTDIVLGQGVGKAGGSALMSGSTVIRVNAGDTLQFRALTEGTEGIGSTRSAFVKKVLATTTISATETISAIYGTTSQSITNGGTRYVVNASTLVEDTHGAVTTGASWKFTAPTQGLYEVKYVAAHSSVTITTGASLEGEVYKNGSLYKPIARYSQQAATAISPLISGAVNVRLNSGDYIDVREAVGGSVSATISDATIYITRLK